VPVPRSIENLASELGVKIYSSSIIYRLIEGVTEGVVQLLPVTTEINVTGEAEVLALFDITMKSGIKQVGGCRVNSGLVERGKRARAVRGGKIIHDGTHIRCSVDPTLSVTCRNHRNVEAS
jgi:translation initiation factor IF-2